MIYHWKKIILLVGIFMWGGHLVCHSATNEERTEASKSAPLQSAPPIIPDEKVETTTTPAQSAPVQSTVNATVPEERKDIKSTSEQSQPTQSLPQPVLSQPTSSKAASLTHAPSLAERLEKVGTLTDLLNFTQEEYDVRLATFKALQLGQDEGAKTRSVESLTELRLLSLNRCCLLTGLTPEWGTGVLRIKKAFFDKIIDQYQNFNIHLLEHFGRETEKGGLTTKNASVLGRYLAYGGQRARFFAETLNLAHADETAFSRGGTGATLDSWTYGVTRKLGVSDTTGYHYMPKNHQLALFGVQREDREVAAQLATLFAKFHEPLGIKETIDYGPYKNTKLDELKVEGELPFHLLDTLQEMKEFWAGQLGSVASLGQQPASMQ